VTRRRAAIVTAGIAAGAVAGGVIGRTVIQRRRHIDPEAHEALALLPPEDLGTVRSFDGTELAVRAAGPAEAPVIVFAHGFSLDLTTWHYQWTVLSERFRCVLFDFRSHGRSRPAAGGDVSIAAMAHDLARVIEIAAGDGRALVVGHSMGGMTALALAESRPDVFAGRVAGVALAGVSSSGLLRGAMGSVTGLLRPRLGSVREAALRVNRVRRYVVSRPGDIGGLAARMTQFGPDASHHLVDYVVGLAARAPSSVWTDGLAGLMDVDLRHAVRHVRQPALVVVGEHDRITPPAAALELTGELSDGRLEVIPGAGHIAMMERHEEFNRVLTSFADEVFGIKRGRERGNRSAGPPTKTKRGSA
jgi:pimeloyl-ACP methyl ester carboxylesterase